MAGELTPGGTIDQPVRDDVDGGGRENKKCYRTFFSNLLTSMNVETDGGDEEEAMGCEGPSAPQSDYGSQTAPTARAAGEPHAQKKVSSGPPRWRFVNEAKKKLGYSSIAAGKVVKGLSAEELVGTYNSPEHNVTRREASGEESINQSAPEIDLKGNEQKERVDNTVGRLHIQEHDWEPEHSIKGSFAGFHGTKSISVELEKEKELNEAQLNNKPTIEKSPWPRELQPPRTEPDMVIQATPVEDELDQLVDQIERQAKLVQKSIDSPQRTVSSTPPPSSHSSDGQSQDELEMKSTTTSFDELQDLHQPSKNRRKKWMIASLLVLIIVIVAIIGGVVGNTRSKGVSVDSHRAINSAVEENSGTDSPTSAPTPEQDGEAFFFVWVGS